jgi:predicted amidohydrolase
MANPIEFALAPANRKTVTVSVAQFPTGGSIELSREHIASAVRAAAVAGAALVVLPEEAMVASDEVPGALGTVAAAEWPGFVEWLQYLARESSIAVIAGGYEPSADGLAYNNLLAVSRAGDILASYRKIHLYDGFNYRESTRVAPGSELPVVIDIEGLRVGLITCYDLRFPEHARYLMDQGADLLSISAAWVKGPRKEDHWLTLIRARAIENTCWVVASGSTAPDCIGESMIVDPYGVVRVALGETSVAADQVEIDLSRTDAVRRAHPALDNRRLRLNLTIG